MDTENERELSAIVDQKQIHPTPYNDEDDDDGHPSKLALRKKSKQKSC